VFVFYSFRITLQLQFNLFRYHIFKFVFELKTPNQKRAVAARNSVILDLGRDYLKACYNGKSSSYVASKLLLLSLLFVCLLYIVIKVVVVEFFLFFFVFFFLDPKFPNFVASLHCSIAAK
jgi:hypothetical protein